MDQEQPQQEKPLTLSQCILNIDSHFEKIKNQLQDEIPQIPRKSKVLIFFGEYKNQFDSFYDHFEIKQVLQNKKHYKLVRIEKEKKESYLLHFPLILTYDDQNDEIAQNLCISKIYAEMIIKKTEKCRFYLILDMQQLEGDDDKTKLDNVFKDSIFYFGSYYFTEDQFYMLRHQQEDKWDYSQFSKQNGFFSFFKKNEVLQYETLIQNQILKTIFKSKNYQKSMKIKSIDDLNYGKMVTYLKKQQNHLKEQIDQNILQFQQILLHLQQMPIIRNNDEIIKEVEEYLKALEKDLNDEKNPLTDSAAQIGEVYLQINKVNKEQKAWKLNERQNNVFSTPMIEFLKDNKIEEKLSIQPLISDELVGKLKRIILFFQNYHNNLFKKEKIIEVQHLKLNLKQWCSYCNEALENTLYELKYITDRIQEGPENEIENGIYFIGVTKAGKSSIINSLLYPENIIVNDDYIGNDSYEIREKTKFEIGKGAVSETQKISGVLIGKQEELDQIFKSANENIYSLEAILGKDENKIQNCKIPKNWFIFDCPGFDDNSNELMRIAHRISLYNYFSKTKNLIAFFVIDISSLNVEFIKNSFDPILSLLENKNDLVQHFEKWTNLILTKVKVGQREKYINNWKGIYQNHLEQNYGFYKKLFANNDRCIEFPKPEKNISDTIKKLNYSVFQMLKNQIDQENNNQFTPKFKLVLDDKIWRLYEQCLPKAKLKLEYIIKFLLQDLDQYILESDDAVQVKQEQILKIKNSLLNQESKKMINEITQLNYKQIIQKIQDWIKDNQYLKDNNIFLQQCIKDMESIVKIQNYCKNVSKMVQFKINIDNLVNKITTILAKIDETIKFYDNISYLGHIGSWMTGIAAACLVPGAIEVIIIRQILLTSGTGLVGSGSVLGVKAFGFVDGWKKAYLKNIYIKNLDEQKKVELQRQKQDIQQQENETQQQK